MSSLGRRLASFSYAETIANRPETGCVIYSGMSRIQQAYEIRFQKLLSNIGARSQEKAAQWFTERSRRLSREQNISMPMASERIYEATQSRIANHHRPTLKSRFNHPQGPIFWCDCGLGGLARWLRATGYEAHWRYHIGDEDLLAEANALGAVVLTTDSGLMERRVVRDGDIPTLWLPPALGIAEQLRIVFREFRLQRRPSRCMSCGGPLHKGNKENLQQRIPPKTYLWLDDYFVCNRCGKLFWHGTHWRKIRNALAELPD